MLKTVMLAGLIVTVLSVNPLFAQTSAPPADQAAPAADQSAPPAAGSKPSNKDLIANCRSDAKSKGLKGAELKASVHDCVAAQKPKVAARMQCRQQGKAQGKAGDDLKAFVKDCMANGQQ